MVQQIYWFQKGQKHPEVGNKKLLGGKGAGLAELCSLGVNVPPGFTITTEVCSKYQDNPEKTMDGIWPSVLKNYKELCKGKELILVSVRSGAEISMPGMMDTVLNVGLNDKNLKKLSDQIGVRAANDCYRRLIQMFGDVVLELPGEEFESILKSVKKEHNAVEDSDLDEAAMVEVVAKFKQFVKMKTGNDFPQDPEKQLFEAVTAVFDSWSNERAIHYRRIHNITNIHGTAVNVQRMVFGNWNEDSGSGVLFTRDPSSGEDGVIGEFLPVAQGEDVVAGIRTPLPLPKMNDSWPEVLGELLKLSDDLERHFEDMQDVEFTVEDGTLYILQTRNAKRSAVAAFKVACDMMDQEIIPKEEVLNRISFDQFIAAQRPMVDPSFTAPPIASGIPASNGVARGKAVFSSTEAVNATEPCILVTMETNPEDIAGMEAAEGILTATGGTTSHAAVVARNMNTPCVTGLMQMLTDGMSASIEDNEGTLFHVSTDTTVTIDGSTGNVWLETEVPVIGGTGNEYIERVLRLVAENADNYVVSTEPIMGVNTWLLVYGHDFYSERDTESDYPKLIIDKIKKDGPESLVLDFRYWDNIAEEADSLLWTAFGREPFAPQFNGMQNTLKHLHKANVLKGVCAIVDSEATYSGKEVLIEAGALLSFRIRTIDDLIKGHMVEVPQEYIDEVIGGDEAYKKLLEVFGEPKVFPKQDTVTGIARNLLRGS